MGIFGFQLEHLSYVVGALFACCWFWRSVFLKIEKGQPWEYQVKTLYYLGRLLQVVALVVLPSAIWIGQFGHNERGAIGIFLGSAFIFYLGWILTKR